MKRRRQNKRKKKKKKGGNKQNQNNSNQKQNIVKAAPEAVDFLDDFLSAASPESPKAEEPIPFKKEEEVVEEVVENPKPVIEKTVEDNSVTKDEIPPIDEKSSPVQSEVEAVEKIEIIEEEEEGEDLEKEKSKNSSRIPYCRECGFPSEYCEFQPDFDTKCKPVLLKDNPEIYKRVMGIRKKELKKLKRKNKGAKKDKGNSDTKVFISLLTRQGKKANSRIEGLEMYGHDIRILAKDLRKKFNCSVSKVDGDKASKNQKSVGDAILIQGDYVDELEDMCLSQWNVPKKAIVHEEKKLKGRKKKNVTGGGKNAAKRRAKTRTQADHDF